MIIINHLGRLDTGETPLQAALRETKEETGLDEKKHDFEIVDGIKHELILEKKSSIKERKKNKDFKPVYKTMTFFSAVLLPNGHAKKDNLKEKDYNEEDKDFNEISQYEWLSLEGVKKSWNDEQFVQMMDKIHTEIRMKVAKTLIKTIFPKQQHT